MGLLLQVFSKQVIFFDYLINQKYIAEVLCENRLVPEKHCNGRCHLKKELEKDSKQQDGSSQKVKTLSEVLFQNGSSIQLILNSIYIRDIYYSYQFPTPNDRVEAIFRPPAC